jgi:hypothetical protein
MDNKARGLREERKGAEVDKLWPIGVGTKGN